MILFHPGFQIRSVQDFRGKQQDPAADMDPFPVVLFPADLPGLDGNDGTVGRIEHFHPVGKVLRKIPLDEKPVYAVAVQAGVDGRHLVIMDDIHQWMQDGSAHIAGVDIGVRDGKNGLHNACKGRKL